MEINRRIIKKASFSTPLNSIAYDIVPFRAPHLFGSSRIISPSLGQSVPQPRGVNLIKLRLYLNDRDPSRYDRARASKYASFKGWRVGRSRLFFISIDDFRVPGENSFRCNPFKGECNPPSYPRERSRFSFESKTFRLTRLQRDWLDFRCVRMKLNLKKEKTKWS